MARKGKKTNGAVHDDPTPEPEPIHRLTIHQPNGPSESMEVAPEPVPIGEAMRIAVEQLGDRVIDKDLAPEQLLELAESYEQVVRTKAAYEARNEAAKTAKKSLESATDLLLEKVKQFTHPASLPLFDQQQAEADLDEMINSTN